MEKLLPYNNFSKYTLAKVEILVWNWIFKLCLRLKALLFSSPSKHWKIFALLIQLFSPLSTLSLSLSHHRPFSKIPPLKRPSSSNLIRQLTSPVNRASFSPLLPFREMQTRQTLFFEPRFPPRGKRRRRRGRGGEKVEETCTPPCVHSSLIVD